MLCSNWIPSGKDDAISAGLPASFCREIVPCMSKTDKSFIDQNYSVKLAIYVIGLFVPVFTDLLNYSC